MAKRVMARKCIQCRKSLRKWIEGVGYVGNGYFCSLRCGFRFGVAAARVLKGGEHADR